MNDWKNKFTAMLWFSCVSQPQTSHVMIWMLSYNAIDAEQMDKKQTNKIKTAHSKADRNAWHTTGFVLQGEKKQKRVHCEIQQG